MRKGDPASPEKMAAHARRRLPRLDHWKIHRSTSLKFRLSLWQCRHVILARANEYNLLERLQVCAVAARFLA